MEPNKRQFKQNQRKSTDKLEIQRGTSGNWEAIKTYTGEVFGANSPKAAKRQAVKQPTSATNNRKTEKVKLNKKETKAALESGRGDYNAYVSRHEDGPVTKSQYAGMVADRPELKAQAIKFAKEDKAQRMSARGK